jgi:hypothetical protein
MRPTPHRRPFDRANYQQPFLDVMDEFHGVMVTHYATRHSITCRPYTVEMSYSIPRPKDKFKVTVVLYISHNQHGVYTKHHFGGEADKPSNFKRLKREIDLVGVQYSTKSAQQYQSSLSRPMGVNVFVEIHNLLERLDCTDLSEREMRHSLKFSGNYRGTRFMLDVYTMKDGRLNTASKMRNGVEDECQNPVWDRPRVPPYELKRRVDQLIQWIKDAEAGNLTASEIAAGPNIDVGLDGLIEEMAFLNL